MRIEIGEIKTLPDGSGECQCYMDDEAKLFIKQKYGRKRLTRQLVERFVREALTEYIKRKEKMKKRGQRP